MPRERFVAKFAVPDRGQVRGDMEHRLPHDPTAPARARRLADDLVRDRLPPARASEFQLMVSEMVSNAVCHGLPQEDGRIGLRLEVEDQVLRAVVLDAAPVFTWDPPTEPPALDQATDDLHFGMFVVDRLSDRWGLSVGGQKAVWVEVDANQTSGSRCGA
jgi:anti-sigma regulatory factor (Ser/Thr protein kinase)